VMIRGPAPQAPATVVALSLQRMWDEGITHHDGPLND
jgi:hypothetical protein